MPTPIIEARQIEKSYTQPDGRTIQVIAPTDLSIYPDSIVALLGPSGSGKSTLLRMLTGLANVSSGEILWHGTSIRRQRPNVSIVFQTFALFPWLTVLANVEAPLKAQGIGEIQRRKRALKILDTVGLDGFETAYPKELSGGMKQRVGFARALAIEPEVLFMDEPFSALDVLTAENLRNELLDLWNDRKIPTRTIFIVTHNIEEAVLLADRIIVLGRNPARIRADLSTDLARPRDRRDPRFLQLVDYIYTLLTQPHVEAPAPADAVAAPRAPEPRYASLPHARPGGIAGLLELLADRGGRDDVYRLAEVLLMEIDDILPIIDAAVLLGFMTVGQGDAEITARGHEFVTGGIEERKRTFRQAALESVPLLRQVQNSLRLKSDHALPDDFFHDILDEHFSDEEAERQLSTAIHWARYAEIFDYDADQRRLVLTEQ